MVRIGYLVPEFPGQTHIFFWRELQSLAKLGVECDLVSTRRPQRRIVAHQWSQEAMQRTTYLWPIGAADVMKGLVTLLAAGPARWWAVIAAITRADLGDKGKRLRMLGLMLVGAGVARLARRRDWRHLHVHSCAESAHVALFARLIGGIPYSVMLHGPLEDYGPNQAMKWHNAAFGIVITQKLLRELHQALASAVPATVDVAPMGVDVERFKRSAPYEPWTGSGPFMIYSCGRLNPCKGHDYLIRAVALVRAKGIDARLRIAGADDSQGQHQAALEALIEELQLKSAVTLLGAVAEEQVRSGLESSHVFALASLHEPLGVAIMEAMALELPVVVTSAGGVTELVSDGVDGMLVDAEDSQGLADMLIKVAQDSALAARLSGTARGKIVTSFRSDQSALVLSRRIGLSQAS